MTFAIERKPQTGVEVSQHGFLFLSMYQPEKN